MTNPTLAASSSSKFATPHADCRSVRDERWQHETSPKRQKTVKAIVKRGLARLLFSVCSHAAWITTGLYVVSAVCGAVVMVIGFWDFLVWLFNTNWRTTNFAVPLWGLGIGIVIGIIAKVFSVLADALYSAAKFPDPDIED